MIPARLLRACDSEKGAPSSEVAVGGRRLSYMEALIMTGFTSKNWISFRKTDGNRNWIVYKKCAREGTATATGMGGSILTEI